MSPLGIFIIGVGVTLLVLGGVYFTVVEMSRLGREADERASRSVPLRGTSDRGA